MQASWELSDATRVVAKMTALHGWTVYVNGVQVPVITKSSGLNKSDTEFQLAQGRPASVSVRPSSYGELEIDLHVDGEAMLFPGKRALCCPSCRSTTRASQTFCEKCGIVQPSRAQRIQERRWRGLSRSILASLYLWFALASSALIRKVLSSQAGAGDDSGPGARLLLEHAGTVIIVVGLAVLSKRKPLTAACLSALLWLNTFAVVDLTMPKFSWGVLLFQAPFAFYAYRAIRIAREVRMHAATLATDKPSA